MKIGFKGQEVEILDPDGFEIIPMKISRQERTASGKYVEDIIAIKRHFKILYDAMAPEDVETFTSLYGSTHYPNFIYDDSGALKEAIVSITSIPRELFVHDLRYSMNITITLEEV